MQNQVTDPIVSELYTELATIAQELSALNAELEPLWHSPHPYENGVPNRPQIERMNTIQKAIAGLQSRKAQVESKIEQFDVFDRYSVLLVALAQIINSASREHKIQLTDSLEALQGSDQARQIHADHNDTICAFLEVCDINPFK